MCSAACIRRGSKKKSNLPLLVACIQQTICHIFPLKFRDFCRLLSWQISQDGKCFVAKLCAEMVCKNELEPALLFTNYPKTELLCSEHSTHTLQHEPSEDVLNTAEILFIYLWHSVLVWALWIVPLTFAEEGGSSRGPRGRWFPRASRGSEQGDSHHTKSVQPVVWWAAVQVQVQVVAGIFPKIPVH